MQDIATKDHQLWIEYQQDTGAKEIGFFNDLEVASEFLAQVSEVPAKFGINEDCSLELIHIVSEVPEKDKYSRMIQSEGYLIIGIGC